MNNDNHQTQPTAPEMIQQSLRSVSGISERLAGFIGKYPHEADSFVGGIKAISEKLDELASATASARDSGGKLKNAVNDIESMAGWVTDRYSTNNSSVSVANSFGRVVGSFAEL